MPNRAAKPIRVCSGLLPCTAQPGLAGNRSYQLAVRRANASWVTRVAFRIDGRKQSVISRGLPEGTWSCAAHPLVGLSMARRLRLLTLRFKSSDGLIAWK
ncbi:MAG: hypothetical protein K5872_11570 [Rhizobiaceae bacterium]|nr:hypothetical protein [Rhizobiaceae bacterium]MCV0406859.1 hypothetical protein [Rhizobiaceae bacterium]